LRRAGTGPATQIGLRPAVTDHVTVDPPLERLFGRGL
jgi:hypothetical protein